MGVRGTEMKLINCTINKHRVEIEKVRPGFYIMGIDKVPFVRNTGHRKIFNSQKAGFVPVTTMEGDC
jgi:hypothetical protein